MSEVARISLLKEAIYIAKKVFAEIHLTSVSGLIKKKGGADALIPTMAGKIYHSLLLTINAKFPEDVRKDIVAIAAQALSICDEALQEIDEEKEVLIVELTANQDVPLTCLYGPVYDELEEHLVWD